MAKAESRSSAALIKEAVEGYWEHNLDWDNDPFIFIKAAGFIKSEVSDMSINHDHYIYGAKKVKK